MITIYYVYHRKIDNTWLRDSKTFYDVNKAVRFAYHCIHSKDKVYEGYECDDPEINEEMNRRIY